MRYKKIMMLAILLVSLLAVSAVSAADNATNDVVCVEETTDEVVSVENENQEIIKENEPGTFTDLANEIANAGNELNLSRNYTYDREIDWGYSGIKINKSIVINGNGFTIKGNHEEWGLFNITGSNVVLNNIVFDDIKSTYGGAVYWTGVNGTLSGCSFIGCYAQVYGGAVFWHKDALNGILSGCSFVKCVSTLGDAGAVEWEGVNGTLSGCSFIGCYAENSAGAVYWMGVNGTLSDSSFVNCYSPYSIYRGGAVYWNTRALNGTLSGCSFENCAAVDGGAVYWRSNNGVIVECSFKNCSASDIYIDDCSGGAVYLSGNWSAVVDCSFIDCSAKMNGGGIYFSGMNCSLIIPIFMGNNAIEGSDWYSEYPLKTTDKLSTVITAHDVSINYGDSGKLVATLKDGDGNILAGEEISIVLNNKEYTAKTNSKGEASLAIPTNLAPETYIAAITYAGKDKYDSSSTTVDVVVNKAGTSISAVYNNTANEILSTLTNANTGKAISSANVKFNINGKTTTVKTNSKGQAKLSIAGLPSGTATISYAGNSKYKSASTNVVLAVKSDIIISAVYDASNNELVATLTNGDTGKVVSGATVQVSFNGETTTVKTNTKGQATISTAGLPLGTNTATISYAGNSKYNSASTSISFDVKTKVIVTDVYAYSDKIVAKLTNGATGKTIANANMIVEINGVKYNAKSDNKGILTFDTTGLDLPSSYDLTISYRGNDRYTASSATVAVDLNKANMMITTNYHADKQKMVATLKNSKTGKVVSNANMIIELNGVKTTYKSNDQGKITLPTADFAPGTYVGTVTYPGNARYNSISAAFKIDI